MSFIDQKYIMMVSADLPKFKQVGSNYNFRCVFCGDSEKNQNIARGYLIENLGDYYSYCHNCHQSYPFPLFLKHVNQTLYDDYIKEKYLTDDKQYKQAKPKKEILHKETENLGIPSIMWLDVDHPARKMLSNRRIPTRWYPNLFYAENFNAFADKHVPDKYNKERAEARVVIPLRTRSGKLSGFQGRAIDPKAKLRYTTVLLAKDNHKLFNLDRVNLNVTNYAIEGAFDAMMLSNAIAACGSDIISAVRKAELNTSNMVFVFDNEPRNKSIVKQMNKAVVNGHKIAIWPSTVTEGHDINDMVLVGKDVEKILLENTYQGLDAELQLTEWKKV